MGKLSAYILGVSFALIVSFYYVYTLYSPLLNWLMPVFGTPLIFVVTFLYILLGNPLKNPMLLVILIFLGFLIGISARKGSRAIGATIFVYGSIWSFIGASVSAILFSDASSGNLNAISPGVSLNSLPPVPKGSSLTQIMSEPLIGRIASAIEGLISQSTSSSSASTGGIPNINFQGIIYEFLPYLLVNLFIILITAGIVGMLINRKIRQKPAPSIAKETGSDETRAGTITAAITIIVLGLLIFSVIPAPMGSTQVNQGNATNPVILGSVPSIEFPRVSPSYNTSLIYTNASVAGSVVSTGGQLFDIFGGYSVVGNTRSPWNSGGSNLVTLEFVGDNLSTLLNSLGISNGLQQSLLAGTSSSGYANLIPEGMMVMVYSGNTSVTSAAANSQMKTLSSDGIGNYVTILSLSTSNFSFGSTSVAGKSLSLYVFGFNPDVYRAENIAYRSITNMTGTDGVIQVLGHGLEDGYLVPGSSANSVNSSVYLAGYINYPQIFNELSRNFGISASTSKSVAFQAGLFEKSNFAHSSSTRHVFTLSNTLDNEQNISLPASSSFSSIFIGSPVLESGKTSYNFSIYSNTNATQKIMSGNVTYHNTTGKTYLDPEIVTSSSNYQYPANLSFNSAIRYLGSGSYQVTGTLVNRDSNPVYNITIDENSIYSPYARDINLTSGKPYLVHSTPLMPNQSISFNYTIHINTPGIYTSTPPLINYTMNGTNYQYQGTPIEITDNENSFVKSVNNIWLSEFSFAARYTGTGFIIKQVYPGFYVFDLIPLLLVLLDIFIEYRAFRRWHKSK